jgi:AraC-like DNA-binding protein
MRGPEPVIKSSIFDGLLQFVAREGLPLDVLALMSEFGIDPAYIARPDVYVPLNPVSHLLERAAVLSGRPCFGLEYASHYPIGASGSLGYLLTHAPSMQDALENLVRYIHAFTHPMHIALEEAEGGVSYIEWMFPMEFTAAMPQYVSFALGAVIERLRHVVGAGWVPLRVDLIHRELPCRELYTTIFGPRVRFDAAHNRMWIDQTSLAARHHGPDERLYRTARLAGDSELTKLKVERPDQPPDIKSRLRGHLDKIMTDGPHDLDSAAAALSLDARKLQYMLEQAGTSFSEELSETRRLRAVHLLTATDQSMSEIAAALGFAEMSSFTRVSRELWFGMAPSKYRQRVRADGVPPPKVETAPEDDTGAV